MTKAATQRKRQIVACGLKLIDEAISCGEDANRKTMRLCSSFRDLAVLLHHELPKEEFERSLATLAGLFGRASAATDRDPTRLF
jgi:hypothetical protein